jgi:hypothetical protein
MEKERIKINCLNEFYSIEYMSYGAEYIIVNNHNIDNEKVLELVKNNINRYVTIFVTDNKYITNFTYLNEYFAKRKYIEEYKCITNVYDEKLSIEKNYEILKEIIAEVQNEFNQAINN